MLREKGKMRPRWENQLSSNIRRLAFCKRRKSWSVSSRKGRFRKSGQKLQRSVHGVERRIWLRAAKEGVGSSGRSNFSAWEDA